ncbi:selenide, water dikinase SelD [Colwellia hornerae]|uniref:Selenide, water dikinase n=1 Tax=Colwellia hornerae TaxID=89402 RepID=A0A5C6QMM7_9GAMM|nr:selenide, water dikinase SelD [Colwellia hornerae]TWX53627.1 selenide, water dikinase SelD [Colwellia hornerae]TWX60278.1 selenide, water dikinase SelD [Colwellia hornerae]TWX70033.1 selenide, water dikinase SelD [Colwellia hornerae]
MTPIRLTQYSHGAGCGCKISPSVLDVMLKSSLILPEHKELLVGNSTKDDAAVFDIGDGQGVISTTDFFMPIVDDATDFGKIAACNAISDVYAMGGKPIMAIAILGWPVNILAPEIAQQVLDGARAICAEAGIPLAGGHSIDAPEPIFGLAVTGLINNEQIKRNNTAGVGDLLYLTKPLGIGIMTTAEKQGKLLAEHAHLAPQEMKTLNIIGQKFAALETVTAMTDVTGFALLGHLLEMCQGSDVAAILNFQQVPCIDFVNDYIDQGCIPGGCERNFSSYGEHVGPLNAKQKTLLCDPQTSGGLLVAVQPSGKLAFEALCQENGLNLQPIGELVGATSPTVSLL